MDKDILMFDVAGKKYGLDVRQVVRVLRRQAVITVPDSPDFVIGVMSLRGNVVPLISLRVKFNLGEQASESNNRVIISRAGDKFIGMLVDEARGVFKIKSEEITSPDEILKNARYLLGVAETHGELVLIIDTEKMISDEEESCIRKVHERVEVKRKEE